MYLLTDIIVNTPELNTILVFIVILVLLFASSLLSGSEIAFFSLGPNDIESLRNNSRKRAHTVLKLYEMPERLIGTILAGNIFTNISIIILSVYAWSEFYHTVSLRVPGLIIQIVILVFIILIFGEILPKVYAARNPVKMVLFMAFPLMVLDKILRPVTFIMYIIPNIAGRGKDPERSHLRMNDFSDKLDIKSDIFEKEERILRKIVNFGNINVNSVMCPRVDVTAADIISTFDKILHLIIETEFSRIPVYKGSFDNVRGILYSRDVLPYINSPANFKWQTLLRQPYFVPETKKINDLLREFQIRKMHMAVVIDEYGGTSGIITLDDILEEIVGELGEEEQEMYRKLNDKTFIFEGKILLNDFYKIIGMEGDPFEEVRGESETLAGLILELTGEIPQKDRKLKYRNFNFAIESADRRRIREIRVEIDDQEQQVEKS